MASSNTSKTAHVMNLLSKNRGGAPAETTPETPAAAAAPETPAVETAAPVQTGDAPKSEKAAPAQAETAPKSEKAAPVQAETAPRREKAAPVAPIISSINADAAVSSQIKDALEAELLEEPEEAEEPPIPAEAEKPSAPVQAETPIPPSAEELMDLPPMKPADPEPIPIEECYVNVMQLLVEEKAEKYMRMFGVCCCERCQLDVKAFALNHLPPKYVFMGPDERVPRLTVYEAQYSSDITAQLLKACTAVHETPHHARPKL